MVEASLGEKKYILEPMGNLHLFYQYNFISPFHKQGVVVGMAAGKEASICRTSSLGHRLLKWMSFVGNWKRAESSHSVSIIECPFTYILPKASCYYLSIFFLSLYWSSRQTLVPAVNQRGNISLVISSFKEMVEVAVLLKFLPLISLLQCMTVK